MLADKSSIAEKLKGAKYKAEFRVNRQGDRILHIAASSGKFDAVEALLDIYDIQINQQNNQQDTALLCACRPGQVEVVRSLLRHGVDASILTSYQESLLHWLLFQW